MSNPKVRIKIKNGSNIDLELFIDKAPISVNNFLMLVDERFYDGVVFHRVIKNFMIQTGGFYIEDSTIKPKEEVAPIKGEFKSNGVDNDLLHEAGVISMARTSNMNSASSQFFICSVDTPHLDGDYASFGKVINQESLDEVVRISKMPTTSLGVAFNDFPREIVEIESIVRL